MPAVPVKVRRFFAEGGNDQPATGWWVHARIASFDEAAYGLPAAGRLTQIPVDLAESVLPGSDRIEWSKHPAVVYDKSQPKDARYLITGALGAIHEGIPADLVRAAWESGVFGIDAWRDLWENGVPFGPTRRAYAKRRKSAYSAGWLNEMTTPGEPVRYFADHILAAEERDREFVIGQNVVGALVTIEGTTLLRVDEPLLSKARTEFASHPLFLDDPENPNPEFAYFHPGILDDRSLRRIEDSGIDGEWVRSLVILQQGSVPELLNPLPREFALLFAELA